jgi:HAD superfamily hydrolase (TIGR01509 family)
MDALIFDFDGVMVDSEKHWKTVGDEVFFPSVVPGWTKADGERMMGLGIQNGFDLLTAEYGLELGFDAYKAKLDEAVGVIYSDMCQLLPGLIELLDRIDTLPKPMGIASSSQRKWIDPALDRFDLRKRFRTVCCANDLEDMSRTKPEPDLYEMAARRLEVDPQKCVALEDSMNGARSAKAARMKVIAIHTDMNEEQDLSIADLHIDHYEELTIEVLKNLYMF